MNRRQVDILDRLLTDSEFYTIDRLAEIFGKTERTIYADISEISRYCEKFGVNVFSVNASGKIVRKDNTFVQVNLLEEIDFYEYELNTQERNHMIICLLLFSEKPLTISSMSEILFCSIPTVKKNMNQVKKILKEQEIQLETFQNKGFFIQGNEGNIRELFLTIAEDERFLLKIFFCSCELFAYQKNIFDLIRKITMHELLRENIAVSENAQVILENYLFLMIYRIQMMHFVPGGQAEQEYASLSQQIISRLVGELEQEELQNEARFLSLILRRLKKVPKEHVDHSLIRIQLLVRIFIEEMSKHYSEGLTKDRELFSNLTSHMFDILNKKCFPETVTKELQILAEQNVELVENIKQNVYIFENYINRELIQTEVLYIALHVMASLEKEKQKQRGLKALVICNSGVGTSQLIKNRLKNHFDFRFITASSVLDLQKHNLENFDLIISTIRLDVEVDLPIAIVSVNITDSDLRTISQVIANIPDTHKAPGISQETAIETIMSQIFPVVSDYNGLFEDIERTVERYFFEKATKEEVALSDLLSEERILLAAEADNIYQTIETGAELLRSGAFVDESFAKEIIASIENYGPYMLIGNDVLFPHAGFDNGALKTGCAFLRLKDPISVTSDHSDQVDLVFMLSAADNQKHLKALFSLISFLQDETFKAKLRGATAAEDVLAVIKKYEQ